MASASAPAALAARAPARPAAPDLARPSRLAHCFDCGQFHRLPALAPGAEARCTRCNSLLAHAKPDPLRRALAWAIAAAAALLVALTLPFMDIDLYGRFQQIVLASGPGQLNRDGMWELALLIGFFTMAAPAARIFALLTILVSLHLAHPPRRLNVLLRFAEHLRVWSMIEVYMLGIFVAYTKLVDLAHVDILAAGYALGALMLLQAAMEAALDREALWQRLEAHGRVENPPELAATLAAIESGAATPGQLIGCRQCGFTVRGAPFTPCPRCGGIVHHRKPAAMQRCAALLVAAAILYIPANLFPVLTVRELGKGAPATILGGVQQLAAAGMYPLAILVFIASITVPAVKLIGLAIVLVTTRRRSRSHLHDRTRLYRVVEIIGRWSMIDIFMLSVLVGLVRLGFVATVTPGGGAIAFAGVVVLTMFAAMAFDPRLMWDAAEANRQ